MRRALRWLALAAVLALLLGALALWLLGRGAFGQLDSEAFEPSPPRRSAQDVRAGTDRQRSAAASLGVNSDDRQILFGDLHVHTTISFDAFMLNLPLLGGQGAATPADACDFARHCAALDFWSINDHASNISPRDWQNTIAAVRRCNDLAGDADNPDMVTFLGWEWTQAGPTPETHFGHKNVVLAHTDDDRIPARPIAASTGGTAASPPPVWARGLLALDGRRFRDLALRWTLLSSLDRCPPGHVRDIQSACIDVADAPDALFRKLDEWGHQAIVIPHGTPWGIYTPPRSTWDKQLSGAMHDEARQTLIEVFSGHGDNEVYRDWRAVDLDDNGAPSCPDKRHDYLPMCQRAGDIVEQRCLAAGSVPSECAERAVSARRHAAAAGISPHITVPGVSGAEWLDAGQCRDCAQPAFSYRPASSAQYIAAIGNFDEPGPPRRFRFGFMASSDIHRARPGTGYKEVRALSETPDQPRPQGGGIAAGFFRAPPEQPGNHSRTYEEAAAQLSGLQLFETERVRSFLYTGGLVAVHARGRDRAAIWDALQRKEVYGTSGPRILLWFDLLGETAEHPMGSELTLPASAAPRLRVRALGSLIQKPGCPAAARRALGDQHLADLCAGECYHPSDRRRRIERIDIVRIRPQLHAWEDIADLIDDPWRAFACPTDEDGCTATFRDDEFAGSGRETVYYARVYEEESPTLNGQPLRCREWRDGTCVATALCRAGEECLSPYAHRAWSSPIYVDWQAPTLAR